MKMIFIIYYFRKDSIWGCPTKLLAAAYQTVQVFVHSLYHDDFDFYICSNNPMEVHLNAIRYLFYGNKCAHTNRKTHKKTARPKRNPIDIAAAIRLCNFMVSLELAPLWRLEYS